MTDTATPTPRTMTGRTLRLPAGLHEQLRQYAFKRRMRMADVARLALVAYYETPAMLLDGPEPRGEAKEVGQTFRLTPDEYAALDARALAEGRRHAAVMRSALEQYLSKSK